MGFTPSNTIRNCYQGICRCQRRTLIRFSLAILIICSIWLKADDIYTQNGSINFSDYIHKLGRFYQSPPKVTHIGFLKVHKAGSTTMQNILFRFGLKNNLTFVLPTNGHYFLKTKQQMTVTFQNHSDILACHSIYSKTLFGSVLPPDTVNIGIIREPLDRMISAAYYYRDVWHAKYLRAIPGGKFIHNLVNYPDKFDQISFSKTKNAMGLDFGFSKDFKENETDRIQNHLNTVNDEFLLVLVMERFEESLILMKRRLHWSLSDVIFLQTNSHKHAPVLLNASEIALFRSTCFLDYAIYEKFSKIFDNKVKEEGDSFSEEVDHFRTILSMVKKFCEDKIKTILEINASKWNSEFYVSVQDCKLMEKKELKFVKQLKDRHIQMNKRIVAQEYDEKSNVITSFNSKLLKVRKRSVFY